MEKLTADDVFDFVFYKIVDDVGFLTTSDQQPREHKPQLTNQQKEWMDLFIKQYGGSDVWAFIDKNNRLTKTKD